MLPTEQQPSMRGELAIQKVRLHDCTSTVLEGNCILAVYHNTHQMHVQFEVIHFLYCNAVVRIVHDLCRVRDFWLSPVVEIIATLWNCGFLGRPSSALCSLPRVNATIDTWDGKWVLLSIDVLSGKSRSVNSHKSQIILLKTA